MEDLNVVIHGNGLNKNGSAHFNLTRSSLKGEALRVFNNKAVEQEEETRDTHIQCLHAITEQVFPKDNPLSKQKTYMRNHVFLHLSDQMISKFCARWIELNNYLDKFPQFEPNQCFTENETKEIFYNIIPKHWQSYLQRDKFDIIHCSVRDFLDIMERYQITNNIDPLLKPKDQSKADKNEMNKSTEKLNDKKHKAKSKKNDSDAPAPKKSCLIHGEDSSHMTNECRTMCKQAHQMKEAWKNTSQAERSRQKREREQQKQKEQNKLHEISNQCRTCLSNCINVIIWMMIPIWMNLTN
jgi:flagellar biosynthesis GTPase FlhF